MQPEFLRRLVAAAPGPATGVVPVLDGFFEPLAALYPKSALPLVEELFNGPDRSLQNFCRLAVAENLLTTLAVTSAERGFFLNWNSPEDFRPEDWS
jgi:molybdopterin-guanine dinucleotide biosynthesis protein A